jgi:hypothetical protein
MGVGDGVSVGTIISVTAMVGDGSICVGSGVKVAVTVGGNKGVIKVAVGVGVGVDTGSNAMDSLTGIENSTCNSGAPAESPSNDFAVRCPFLPDTIMTMEFPEFQLG